MRDALPLSVTAVYRKSNVQSTSMKLHLPGNLRLAHVCGYTGSWPETMAGLRRILQAETRGILTETLQ